MNGGPERHLCRGSPSQSTVSAKQAQSEPAPRLMHIASLQAYVQAVLKATGGYLAWGKWIPCTFLGTDLLFEIVLAVATSECGFAGWRRTLQMLEGACLKTCGFLVILQAESYNMGSPDSPSLTLEIRKFLLCY